MIAIPRFQGTAHKLDDGWIYEIHVSMLGGDITDVYRSYATFMTKEIAIEEMRKEIRRMVEVIAKKHPELGIDVDNYIDMKANSTMKWDKNKNH